MSDHKKRIDAIQVILAGSVIAGSTSYAAICSEFDLVHQIRRQVKRRTPRQLLQVVHCARALDTALKCYTDHHGCTGDAKGLGGYLGKLKSTTKASPAGSLSDGEVRYYRDNISSKRNTYMHEAGVFPADDAEIRTLLSEMEACLFRVVNL